MGTERRKECSAEELTVQTLSTVTTFCFFDGFTSLVGSHVISLVRMILDLNRSFYSCSIGVCVIKLTVEPTISKGISSTGLERIIPKSR